MRELSNLREELDATAGAIDATEPDPAGWDVPILYLLESLESLALGHDGLDGYEAALEKVRTGIADRLDQGNW